MSTGYEWVSDQFTITGPMTSYTAYTESSVRRIEAPAGKKIVATFVKTIPASDGSGLATYNHEMVDEGDAIEGYGYAYTGSGTVRAGQEYTVTTTLVCVDA